MPLAQLSMDYRLAILGALVLAYCVAEIVLGIEFNSATLTTDGLHNLGDAFGFALAIIISAVKAWEKHKSKADRIALIGGFANCTIVLILTFVAGVESAIRFFVPEHVHIGPMFFVCVVSGFFIKAFGVFFLGGLEVNMGGVGHTHSHGDAGHSHAGKHSDDEHTDDDQGFQEADSCRVAHEHSHGHGHQHDRDGKLQEHQGTYLDENVYAIWLHTLQDAVASLIVLIVGLVIVFSGRGDNFAAKADAVGGVTV